MKNASQSELRADDGSPLKVQEPTVVDSQGKPLLVPEQERRRERAENVSRVYVFSSSGLPGGMPLWLRLLAPLVAVAAAVLVFTLLGGAFTVFLLWMAGLWLVRSLLRLFKA